MTVMSKAVITFGSSNEAGGGTTPPAGWDVITPRGWDGLPTLAAEPPDDGSRLAVRF